MKAQCYVYKEMASLAFVVFISQTPFTLSTQSNHHYQLYALPANKTTTTTTTTTTTQSNST